MIVQYHRDSKSWKKSANLTDPVNISELPKFSKTPILTPPIDSFRWLITKTNLWTVLFHCLPTFGRIWRPPASPTEFFSTLSEWMLRSHKRPSWCDFQINLPKRSSRHLRSQHEMPIDITTKGLRWGRSATRTSTSLFFFFFFFGGGSGFEVDHWVEYLNVLIVPSFSWSDTEPSKSATLLKAFRSRFSGNCSRHMLNLLPGYHFGVHLQDSTKSVVLSSAQVELDLSDELGQGWWQTWSGKHRRRITFSYVFFFFFFFCLGEWCCKEWNISL
jgi:hypothetical protein